MWNLQGGVNVVQTEDVFRRANEEIAELGRGHGWRFPVPFLCECADRHCFAGLELTLEAYEELRSDSKRYLTVPGDAVAGAMVIEQTKNYALNEKLYA